LYVVVDLSGGPDAASYPVRYTDMLPNLDDDTCRTTELWLRKIPKGTFIMGSPEDEIGHWGSEKQHEVTLTRDYYIGVFECTQRQWELVMGTRPSYYKDTDYYMTRPVESVSYDMIRGASPTAGAGWPAYGHVVDDSSFLGKLQAKTGLTFDLPTEAQWEYACRAGTTTAFNSGKNLVDASLDYDINMSPVGRYQFNGGGGWYYSEDCSTAYGTAKVGSYLPNKWGLYDMHGNILEWCLNWDDIYSTTAEKDPGGPYEGSRRVKRGGYWGYSAQNCRSASRNDAPLDLNCCGFRVACLPSQDLYVVVDLSDGPTAERYPIRYTRKAPNLKDDTCRTTELWLRRIPAGTFVMGSPNNEAGHPTFMVIYGEDVTLAQDERQHEVTLTRDYYIGVFECTQKQWELVMGDNPSENLGDCRPVECVSYNMIRGTGSQAGAGWPMYGHTVDVESFMGKLQKKTGLVFDLPTEAQWEYACRARTTTALNSGKDLLSEEQDTAMDEVGRYIFNENDGKGGFEQFTKVGSYQPNAWGLYDMHGNVQEWCADRYNSDYYNMTAVEDPLGPNGGSSRVMRGGSWELNARYCRSAYRGWNASSSAASNYGFRIVWLP
jgi:formylglycine-generating enzyme required for sulfatase activity